MKEEIFRCKTVKKDFGINIGRHWKKYKNLGRTFILITFTLPIKDKGRHFQDMKRDLTWLWRGLILALNRSEYLRVTWIPRYLKRFLTTLNWKSEYEIWREDEFNGNNSLLQKFSLYPEKLLKVSKIERIWGIEVRGLDRKIRRSSAYKETLCTLPARVIPQTCALERRAIARGSIAMANNNGERGQPCLVPRCSLKYSEKTLLVRTEALGAAYKIWIQDINMGP